MGFEGEEGMGRPKAKMTSGWEKVLKFIRAYVKMHGVSPSYEVMAKALGMKSKSNMHRIVRRLEEEGHLEVRPRKTYGVRLRDKSVAEVLSL